MEYAANGNLNAYLNRQMQPLAWSAKRCLCQDVARGLEFLHAREPQPIVHGDLKVRVVAGRTTRVDYGFDTSAASIVCLINYCFGFRIIQSSSVLIDGDHVAKLCDFGMPDVKLGLQRARASSSTHVLRWSAPELAQVSPNLGPNHSCVICI
jgi:serine/threonine protein kinase